MDDRAANKRRCPAMIEAEIEDPQSQDGIDFCVYSCPYKTCIAFDRGQGAEMRKASMRAAIIDMIKKGLSITRIAEELGVHKGTVQRRLEEARNQR